MTREEARKQAKQCQRIWRALHVSSLQNVSNKDFLAAIGILLSDLFARLPPCQLEVFVNRLYRVTLSKKNAQK